MGRAEKEDFDRGIEIWPSQEAEITNEELPRFKTGGLDFT